MTALAIGIALISILAAGLGLVALLTRRSRVLSWSEGIALSWILGSAFVSLLLWLIGTVLHGISLQILVATICAVLGAIGWKSPPMVAGRFRPSRVVQLLMAIVALEIAIVLFASLKHPLGWDGMFNWEIKARYAFLNEGSFPASYARSSGLAFSNVDYPLAIPFTELWLYLWLGEANQFSAKFISPMYYAAAALLLVALGSRLTGKIVVGLSAAALLFFTPQFVTAVGSAIVGLADLPLAVFYLATIGFLLSAIYEDDPSCFRIYAACLAFLPWIKNEGTILWGIGVVCGLVVNIVRKRSLAYYLWLAPGFLILVAWRSYLALIHAVSANAFLPVTFETFRSHLSRIGPISSALLSEMMDMQTWSLFWLIVAVACAYLMRRGKELRTVILFTALFTPIVLDIFIYVFSGWPNYRIHVGLSISRLLMQVAPVGMLAAMMAVTSWQARSSPKRRLPAHSCAPLDSERTATVEFA